MVVKIGVCRSLQYDLQNCAVFKAAFQIDFFYFYQHFQLKSVLLCVITKSSSVLISYGEIPWLT